jgi:cytochrome P450
MATDRALSYLSGMGSLYDADFLLWSEQQAELLRRLAAGERVNDAVDWPNLIEEVEALGRSEVGKVRTALLHLMEHASLIALCPPDHRDIPHWSGEMRMFRDEAVEDYRPSMRQVLAPRLDRAWAAAREAAARKLAQPITRLPERRPFTLQDLPLDDLPERLRSAG